MVATLVTNVYVVPVTASVLLEAGLAVKVKVPVAAVGSVGGGHGVSGRGEEGSSAVSLRGHEPPMNRLLRMQDSYGLTAADPRIMQFGLKYQF